MLLDLFVMTQDYVSIFAYVFPVKMLRSLLKVKLVGLCGTFFEYSLKGSKEIVYAMFKCCVRVVVSSPPGPPSSLAFFSPCTFRTTAFSLAG